MSARWPDLPAFRVTGTFAMGSKAKKQPFGMAVVADAPEAAKERVLSILGSRHRVDRRRITVDKVESIKAEDIDDPVLRHRLGA